jgi:hypothetical protein
VNTSASSRRNLHLGNWALLVGCCVVGASCGDDDSEPEDSFETGGASGGSVTSAGASGSRNASSGGGAGGKGALPTNGGGGQMPRPSDAQGAQGGQLGPADGSGGVDGVLELGGAGTTDGHSGGAAGTGTVAPRYAKIFDAWPKSVASGQLLLVAGENLTASKLLLDEVELQPACVDQGCFDDSKVVVLIPSSGQVGPAQLSVADSDAEPLPLRVIEKYQIPIPVSRAPRGNFTPLFLGEGRTYDPISDRWTNECDLYDDRYFFSAGDSTPAIQFFDGVSDNTMQGSIGKRSGLVRLTISSTSEDFVGVFSATAQSFVKRLVFFSANVGRELVLFHCDGEKASAQGGACPPPGAGGASSTIVDAPSSCSY